MRELFLLDPNIVFLNHGSFGACPAEVFAVYQSWQLELERNPVEFLGRRSGGLLEQSRQALGQYLGARADDLVLVPNATTGVNTVARSLALRPGDEVLTTDHEYGACDNAWEHVCRRQGARYVRAHIPLPLRAADFAATLWARVTERTRLIQLSQLTSSTALIFPVAEICKRARASGVLTLIDGAHAPGQLPLDLATLGADFYAGNCHKWLCAPKGAGFLYVRPEHHELLDAVVISWGYSTTIQGHTGFEAYTGRAPLVRRHQWQGTRDIAAFLAVPAAIEFEKKHDWPRVQRDCHALAIRTAERVAALTGLEPIGADEDFAQMVAMPIPVCDADALKRTLYDSYRIEVPITSFGSQLFVRASWQAYNTEADAEALLDALACLLADRGRFAAR
jgi:isopenicillin-N epimerase